LLAISACNQQPEQPAAPAAPAAAPVEKEPIEATVNGVDITKKRVDMIAKQAGADPENPEVRKNIVDQLTMQMLAAEEAVKKGLDKTPEIADQLEVLKLSLLANAYVQDFVKTNKITDEAVQTEYDRIKATVTGSEYKARHILVEKEADAKALIAKLKKKPDQFAKLAKEKSKDTNSGANGGDLGWFDLSRMVPEFGAAVSKLEKGKMTDEPVKTQYGYHIIIVDDIRPIEPPPLDQVKAGLTQQLQQQALKKNLDDIKAKAKITVVAPPEAKPEAAPAPAEAPADAAAAPAASTEGAPAASPEAAPAAKSEAAPAVKAEAAPAAKPEAAPATK
jgi:peptidyl-prolyl cis-trans isomerase C